MTNHEKYEINLNRTTCLLSGFQIANINQTFRLIKMKYNNSCTYREPFMYFCVTCSFGPSRRGWNDIQKAETMGRNVWFLSTLVLSKWEIPQLSRFVYFLRKVCSFFNFWMIKCTSMSNKTWLWISSFKNWNINTFSPKSIQTEKTEKSLGERTKLSQFVYFLWKVCLFYTNWAKLSSLVLREQEETKTRYFTP